MNPLLYFEPNDLGLRIANASLVPLGVSRSWEQVTSASGLSPGDVVPWAHVSDALGPNADSDLTDALLVALNAAHIHVGERTQIRLSAHGSFTDRNFSIDITLALSTGERVDSSRIVGMFYSSRTMGNLLLDSATFRMLEEYHNGPGETPEARYAFWGRLRPLCESLGANLDPYLRDTEVEYIDAIRPQLDWLDGELSIRARSSTLDADVLEAAFGRTGVQAIQSVQMPGGKRKRIVTSERARAGAIALRQQPKLGGRAALEALDNLESFFDPDVFDLSEFSDRVVGIGPPRYRAVVAQSRGANEQRSWLPETEDGGICLELTDVARPEMPPLKVDLTDDVVRRAVETQFSQAIAQDEPYANIQIPGDEHSYLVKVSPDVHAALVEYETRAKQAADLDQAGNVLIIQDNLEQADHVLVDAAGSLPNDFNFPLSRLLSPDCNLYPHQLIGHQVLQWWLSPLSGPIGGGLVADDMGLGKTLQVIALLASLAERGELKPALIVAPTSLLENWRREIARFAPAAQLRVVSIQDLPRGGVAWLQSSDIVVSSYEMLTRRQVEMGRVDWSVVVCDEAQKIKNPSARMTAALKAMKSRGRLALTGTPVENSLEELWCIVDFALPGLLGALSAFKNAYANPRLLANQEDRETAANELRRRLGPVMLRRMKRDVLADQLPALRKVELEVGLSPIQRSIYARLHARAKTGGRGGMLAALQHLLATCAHPFALYTDTGKGLNPIASCPKLEQTIAWLREIQKRGEKALVFVRWNRVQLILAEAFEQVLGLTRVPILNGAMPSEHRQRHVDAFQRLRGFGVMILAPRACGTGLNITAANHVIHYTREWNPAIEAQATDRVYRIGQERPVTVYFPIVTHPEWDSVEVVLARLLNEKESLREDFLQPSTPVDGLLADRLADLPSEDPGAELALSVSPQDLLDRLVNDGCGQDSVLIQLDGTWISRTANRWWGVTDRTDYRALSGQLAGLELPSEGTLLLRHKPPILPRFGDLKQRARLIYGGDVAKWVHAAAAQAPTFLRD